MTHTNIQNPNLALIKRTIFYRNHYIGGDGWTYYPVVVDIHTNCPECGTPRGEATPYTFYEDGEWFTVDRWENPCGHIDSYQKCWAEAKAIQKMIQEFGAEL